MTDQATNPKDAQGARKAGLSCVPALPLLEVGVVCTLGAAKYGRHNWRDAGVRASVYYAAAQRHMMKWWEGEDADAESGVSHLMHAAACMIIARDAEMRGGLDDDRPPKCRLEVIDELAALIAAIKDEHPDPPAPVTQAGIDEAWAMARS